MAAVDVRYFVMRISYFAAAFYSPQLSGYEMYRGEMFSFLLRISARAVALFICESVGLALPPLLITQILIVWLLPYQFPPGRAGLWLCHFLVA